MLTTPYIEKTNFIILGKETNENKRLALHEVDNGTIGAEVPFTKETARGIFSIFKDQEFIPKQFKGIIPSNFLVANDDAINGLNLVWRVEKSVRKIFYSKGCELKTSIYSIPNLILRFKNNSLSVFALTNSDAKNIQESTLLYHAPFFNVDSDGSICMGNVKLTTVKNIKSFEAAAQFLENSFFNSVFTHTNNSELITHQYIKKLQETKQFSNQNLYPTKENLKNIL